MRATMSSRAAWTLVLLLWASEAWALQEGGKPVTTGADKGDTVRVTTSGRVVLDYVYRSKEVATFTEGGFGGGGGGDPSESTFEGFAAVRLDVELASNVSALIEIGTLRVDNANINFWGGAAANGVQLREAQVVLSSLAGPGLSAELGISTWSFNLRGRGGAFAFDPRRAQTITHNLDPIVSTFDTITAMREDGRSLDSRAGQPDELQPVGAVVRYQGGSFSFDVALLPAAVEGGSARNDEGLYAVNAFYALDSVGEGSRVGLILAASSFGDFGLTGQGSNSAIYTAGGGATVKGLLAGLEVYVEGYFQFGGAGRQDVNADGVDDDLKAAGKAFQAGLEWHYTVGNPLPFWIGVNFTYLSGDGDAITDQDDSSDRFAAYDGVSDLLILEDMYFGFDWDSNFKVIKISGGLALSVGEGKDNLDLSFIVGIARTAEDVEFGPAVGGKDQLGNEVDVRARWTVHRQFVLHGAVALLFGSEVLENSMESDGFGVAQPGSNPSANDKAWIFTLGFDLSF